MRAAINSLNRELIMSIKSTVSSVPIRHVLFATSAAVGAFGLFLLASPGHAQAVPASDSRAPANTAIPEKSGAATEDKSIRPFHVNISEEALVDLRHRVTEAKWPER